MDKLSPPTAMQLTGNLADNWKRFKQRFNIYLTASGAGADDEKLKANILLHVMGEDALDIYNSFQLDEANITLAQLMEKFEEYFVPKQNVTFERYKFFTHNQKHGLPFDQYLAELHTLSKTCEFGNLRDSLVRDRIVCGTVDNALRERLLRETGLTLDKCVTMCRAAETTRAQAKELRRDETTVHAVHKEQMRKKTFTKQKEKSAEFKCGKCAGTHKPKSCPAYGKSCNNCGKSNHYARCCKAAAKKKVHAVDEEDEDDSEFIVDVVQACATEKEEWIMPIKVNETVIPFKLDTGAHVNLLSWEDYKIMTVKSKIHPIKTKVTGYTGERIPVKGGCIATFQHKGQQIQAQLLIVDANVQPILGLKTCTKLNLVKRVFVVTSPGTVNDHDSLMEEYKDCFEGLGCLPGEHKICVDKSVSPVVHPCRKIPFALRNKLKEELVRMEKLGVIKKIDEPTEWFYDPERSTRISADASQFGLGAVLLQQHDGQWLPVAYASRALTSAESRYAQIEKELLASLYACERFHQYVYGQAFEVETDHKPLVSIMSKPLNDCPLRIQRMLIRLHKYDVHMLYTQGKYMYTADTLSRAVDKEESADSEKSAEIQAYVDMVVSSLPITGDRTEQIRRETSADEVLKELKITIQKGWPENRKDCPITVQDYWNCRAELTVVDDIVMKGSKFVIPSSLRKQMLQKIHEGHLGEVKCKRRAREVMYWPRINHDISQTTASCDLCRIHRPKQQAEPLMTHPVPHRPYYKVGTDLFDCDGKSYILVTDYFSNYPEVGALQSTSSKAVISFLKTVFARHGIPCELFSDNGPQFTSCEFEAFAEEWGFQHKTSSPNYPRSNGLAEGSVKIIKNMMKKAQDRDDFQKSLLIYRSAPLQNGLSPAQMLMGRRIRSNLPVNEDLLTPKGAHKVTQLKEEQKAKQKKLHDRMAKHLPILKLGDTVRLRDISTGTWRKKGRVEEEVAPRSFRIQVENGTSLRRNRTDLQLQTTGTDMAAQEMDQQDPAESGGLVSSGLTAASASPADVTPSHVSTSATPERLARPKRQIHPPKRLIESC
ncbi:uncharacterized protein LOC119782701 [Cyprinodon tularosa]|uniref:uncharacterized protein LOC119782701 n=1 Tax=Cyprinodon tularosa TaxID=77115 RepID=UPI0018E22A01|nr:uncharacterized protein LOC119782701 [Cyprinodon tularosa]